MLAKSFVSRLGFGEAAGDLAVLNHALVPFRGSAVYLRLVNTVSRALDYAAGGFHVSVDRGLAGGCLDPWEIHKGGTKAVSCANPRNNETSRAQWAAAAQGYLDAYKALQAGAPLTQVKTQLMSANLAADKAYAEESAASVAAGGPPIVPPRDPQTGAVESAAARPSRVPRMLMGVGAGMAAFGLAAALAGKKFKKGKKGTSKSGSLYVPRDHY